MNNAIRSAPTLAFCLWLGGLSSIPAADLWELAKGKQAVHRFSTLMTAQNVRDLLSTEQGLAEAIAWCRQTGVTKVYLETFRSNYTAPAEMLKRARDRFRSEGFQVSGCVTTTNIGKRSTGWNLISWNFNDQPVTVELDGQSLSVRPRGWTMRWK